MVRDAQVRILVPKWMLFLRWLAAPLLRLASFLLASLLFRRWQQWVKPMIDTVAMSIAGTAIAIVMSVPLAFLAARNTTPNATATTTSPPR